MRRVKKAMSHDAPGDRTQPIGRWVLGACAKVSDQSPDQAEHMGLLVSDPEIGEPLVVAVGDDQRITTSTVQRLESGPNDSLYVHTRNSLYWIRRLSRHGNAE